MMSNKNSCIAIFKTHQEAEQAVMELEHAGFDMKKLSIVGKNYERQEKVTGYYNGINRVKFWSKRGALWGGLWGVLFSPAFMCVPGAGSLSASGLLFVTLANGISTAIFTGGFTALGVALYSIGIPKNSIIHYETAIKMEKYLLIVHGTSDEVEHAKDILDTGEEAEVAVYAT
ncbi:MAG TPA: permease [Leucothrix sp.]|nr:permease [Leucothrix sp.]